MQVAPAYPQAAGADLPAAGPRPPGRAADWWRRRPGRPPPARPLEGGGQPQPVQQDSALFPRFVDGDLHHAQLPGPPPASGSPGDGTPPVPGQCRSASSPPDSSAGPHGPDGGAFPCWAPSRSPAFLHRGCYISQLYHIGITNATGRGKKIRPAGKGLCRTGEIRGTPERGAPGRPHLRPRRSRSRRSPPARERRRGGPHPGRSR